MKDRQFFALLIGAVCLAGFTSQWEVIDRFLSTVFAWVLLGGGGFLLTVLLVREVWDLWRDWRAMGPPDLGPLRSRGRKEREQEETRQ